MPELFGKPQTRGHPLRCHPTTKTGADFLAWSCLENAHQAINESEPLASLRDDLASQVPDQIAVLPITKRGRCDRCHV